MARNVVDEPGEDLVAKSKEDRASRRGFFGRIALFFRQVIGELKKVVTPTWPELLRFTGVVLVFVVIMMGIVTGFDYGFGWIVAWIFGDPSFYTG